MTGFEGFDNSTNKRILNKLETVFLRLRKIEVEGVAVIKLRVNSVGGDGTKCFEIMVRTNTTKVTNVRISRFIQCRDLVRESEVFIKDKANISSRVSGIKRGVVYFSKVLLPIRRHSVLQELRVNKLAVIHEEICCYAQVHFAE